MRDVERQFDFKGVYLNLINFNGEACMDKNEN